MNQLTTALILFVITQLGTVAAAVLLFRSETKALRREVEQWRSADKELAQLKLDQIMLAVSRLERKVDDVVRLAGGGKRVSDHLTTE